MAAFFRVFHDSNLYSSSANFSIDKVINEKIAEAREGIFAEGDEELKSSADLFSSSRKAPSNTKAHTSVPANSSKVMFRAEFYNNAIL